FRSTRGPRWSGRTGARRGRRNTVQWSELSLIESAMPFLPRRRLVVEAALLADAGGQPGRGGVGDPGLPLPAVHLQAFGAPPVDGGRGRVGQRLGGHE